MPTQQPRLFLCGNWCNRLFNFDAFLLCSPRGQNIAQPMFRPVRDRALRQDRSCRPPSQRIRYALNFTEGAIVHCSGVASPVAWHVLIAWCCSIMLDSNTPIRERITYTAHKPQENGAALLFEELFTVVLGEPWR